MLGLFQRAFPSPEFLAFRENAKQIAGVLGEARNWDVFLQLLQDGPAAAFPEVPGFDDIVAQSQQLRAAGYERVRERLAAAETTRFVLSLQAFVARHGWRNAGDAQALSRLTEPAKTFAATNLNRMHVKLTKHGKNLGGLAPHKRHQIRIELKKLRYAVDLFAGLFASGRLTDHRRITAKLQDQLGSFNDLITAHEMAARLDNAVPATHYAAGIITGWCGRGARLDDKNLAVLWKKFRKLK
jgi:triphosphatase